MTSQTDEVLLALIKMSPEQRLGVLQLLPEWQRVMQPNDLRVAARREVIEALIEVVTRAQKHATSEESPLNSLLRQARAWAASLRIDEKEKRST